MSLIQCPECGKEVSDKARSCPNCGYPIQSIKEEIRKVKEELFIESEEKEIEDIEIKALENILKVIPNNQTFNIIKKLSEDFGIGLKHSKKIVDYYFENAEFNVCPQCGIHNNKENIFCNECGYRIKTQFDFINVRKDARLDALNNAIIKSKNDNGNYDRIDLVEKAPLIKAEKEEFCGIYKYTFWGSKQEVHCPRCGSEDCSHFQQQKIIPAKTKTRYTANLNPFKPFTLVNKKEKIVKKGSVVMEDKIVCNKCGYIGFVK